MLRMVPPKMRQKTEILSSFSGFSADVAWPTPAPLRSVSETQIVPSGVGWPDRCWFRFSSKDVTSCRPESMARPAGAGEGRIPSAARKGKTCRAAERLPKSSETSGVWRGGSGSASQGFPDCPDFLGQRRHRGLKVRDLPAQLRDLRAVRPHLRFAHG